MFLIASIIIVLALLYILLTTPFQSSSILILLFGLLILILNVQSIRVERYNGNKIREKLLENKCKIIKLKKTGQIQFANTNAENLYSVEYIDPYGNNRINTCSVTYKKEIQWWEDLIRE